ncbi:MAG: VOC family protein [Gammaproteobacteria bacterium]|nr:VOC family protein [Gammaproteobacteria bacterium]
MGKSSNLTLSHLELRVANVSKMERFYTDVLGFVSTDRGKEKNAMVFLSRSPDEHHQIVLNPGGDGAGSPGALDHIALRVASLKALRKIYGALKARNDVSYETVSHGTTWSIYMRDPEGNRVEVFTDTPWHVSQPVRFEIDLDLTDEDLVRRTEETIRARPGFGPADAWKKAHRSRFEIES